MTLDEIKSWWQWLVFYGNCKYVYKVYCISWLFMCCLPSDFWIWLSVWMAIFCLLLMSAQMGSHRYIGWIDRCTMLYSINGNMVYKIYYLTSPCYHVWWWKQWFFNRCQQQTPQCLWAQSTKERVCYLGLYLQHILLTMLLLAPKETLLCIMVATSATPCILCVIFMFY